jgi:predicted GIY-YIG superfamily endonuclease
MHSDLVELGWTEEHFNRIDAVVTEEAQKARVRRPA